MTDFSKIFTIIVNVFGIVLFAILEVLRVLISLLIPASYEPVKTVAGEIILITGAANGLGRELAVKLANRGAKIVLWDIDVKGLEKTYKFIKDSGGVVYRYKCDLRKREDVYQTAEEVKKDVGDVSILINNAGVVSGYWILDIPDHLIQRTFEVNSMALFWTVKAFMPKMIEKNRGHVVTIGSMAGHMASPKLSDYCASKYAAFGFDEGLRLDLAVKGITGVKTTIICPNFIADTGICNEVITNFRKLTVEEVVDRTILAILREEVIVMLPLILRLTFWFKWLGPWSVVQKIILGMITDPMPKPGSCVTY
ncbi:short chain dehydrogenase [Popillia japonica]|uniref:Short-chain dehydrogenase/reductase 3 n=1 Tax=Popillia japonica TaxID=7064 RepID=A0AAW1JV01_POPJA